MNYTVSTSGWPLWRKIVFRFFLIYVLLQIAPWMWAFDFIPGFSYLLKIFQTSTDWLVETSNRFLFHVRNKLIPPNGSGDTSYAWAYQWLSLLLGVVGCLVWSLIDSKRKSYDRLDYFFRLILRYYLVIISMIYGVLKVFVSQMVFPNLSQLATPLGDFLPMRFSWLFIGYSTSYQFFAGLMEVIVGLLLLNRRTVTLGLLMGLGVFSHLMVLNLFYDIPVKLFSMHLVVFFLYLLMNDSRRLISILVFNEPAGSCKDYDLVLNKRSLRIGRIILKVLFIIFFVAMPFYNNWGNYQRYSNTPEPRPFYGVYDVAKIVTAGDTLVPAPSDTILWKDIIFDKSGTGSVNTTDTLFRQRYRRGYFNYSADTLSKTIQVFKRSVMGDSTYLFAMRYRMNSNTVKLWTKIRNDSMMVELVKSKRHFQLAERQFHWLSEYNR